MLTVSELSVAFGQYGRGLSRRRVEVLRSVSLEVGEAEIVAICGESGAGKSVLADALTGVLPANAQVTGDIAWEGKMRPGKELRLIPQGVGAFDPTMRIGDFVGNDAALERFGVGDLKDSYPGELSGGQLRRALLATSAGKGVRLVIADEPTPGLDPVSVDVTLSYFQELREHGTSVLLITHDLVAASRIADRVVIMRAGEIVDGDSEYARALWHAQTANNFWGKQC